MTHRTVRGRRGAWAPRAFALAVTFGLIAAACGGDDSGAADTGAISDTTEAGAGGTRTITHQLGTVEVPVDPQRIVSVGYEEQQMLLHFGKVPIFQRDYTFGDQPFGVWPWDMPSLEGAEPEIFEEDEIPFERIAALEPDLIMGVNAGLQPDQYERLSEIAPTVAQPVGYEEWNAPFVDQFRFVGQVFGMEEEAEKMLAETEASLAEVAAAHPEWAEMYAGSLTIWDPIVNADTTDHARGQLLAALGFKPITEDVLPFQDDYPTVPFEQLDLLDELDLLLWMIWEPTPEVVLDLPLRDALVAHREGREVYIPPPYSAAFQPAPHAVAYLIEWLVPQLEAATDGDPATPVPSSVEAGIAPG